MSMAKTQTQTGKLVGKITKLMVQASFVVERDGVTVAEANAQPFAVFAGQPVDFSEVIATMETALNQKPDELLALVEQCRPKV